MHRTAFALALLACSKTESPPPTPLPSASVPVEAAATTQAAEMGSCDLGFKCTEWTGELASKKKSCAVVGKWTATSCANRSSAVAECAVTDKHGTGTVFYGPEGKANAPADCARQAGAYQAK